MFSFDWNFIKAKEQVNTQCNPDLSHRGVLTCADKRFDFNVTGLPDVIFDPPPHHD